MYFTVPIKFSYILIYRTLRNQLTTLNPLCDIKIGKSLCFLSINKLTYIEISKTIHYLKSESVCIFNNLSANYCFSDFKVF